MRVAQCIQCQTLVQVSGCGGHGGGGEGAAAAAARRGAWAGAAQRPLLAAQVRPRLLRRAQCGKLPAKLRLRFVFCVCGVPSRLTRGGAVDAARLALTCVPAWECECMHAHLHLLLQHCFGVPLKCKRCCKRGLISCAFVAGHQAGAGPEEGWRAARGQMLLSTDHPAAEGMKL